MKNKVLITGAAGFIGFHLSKQLLNKYRVIGLDNINKYYDTKLKEDRLEMLLSNENFSFYKIDLKNSDALFDVFKKEQPDYVVNLAAQAGVRYSLENPNAYIDSNIVGFTNILEACRAYPVKHLLYASSSSVYGGNKKVPFSENDQVDHPVSLYAATKKANELMAHTYSHLYKIPTTGLRFFTVYGPWGRPDMAYFSFTKKIFENEIINVYNNGKMERDFTYIDDIVQAIDRLLNHSPKKEQKTDNSTFSGTPYAIYNIGNNNPVKLETFISILENHIGKQGKKNYMPMQPGDVPKTYADVSQLMKEINYKPSTTLDLGLKKFVSWYKNYYMKMEK